MVPSVADRIGSIEILILDVDGVLTDGTLIYGDNGVEIKAFHVRDGTGIKFWHQAGKRSALITGRRSNVVARRAEELGIATVVQGAADKVIPFEQILDAVGLNASQACYMGDDLPDLPVLCRCGLGVAVADACPEVRKAAHHVTQAVGGRGAVRETIELLLRGQGCWHEVVDRYLASAER